MVARVREGSGRGGPCPRAWVAGAGVWAHVAACGEGVAGGGAPGVTPLVAPGAAEASASVAPVEIVLSSGAPVTLVPLGGAAAGLWLSDVALREHRAVEACAYLGAGLFTPRTAAELGAAVSAASLSAALGSSTGVWTGLRLDLDLGLVVDEVEVPAFPWRVAAPPLSGRPDVSQEARAQEDVERVARGEAPVFAPHCFAVTSAGALEVTRCGSNEKAALCAPSAGGAR